MTNNDILRRIRYVFDFGDSTMISIFALADRTVTRAESDSMATIHASMPPDRCDYSPRSAPRPRPASSRS